MKSKYDISGMSCSACSARVEKSVGALDGVKEVNVNLISGVMTVEYDEQKVTEADMKKAVESGGVYDFIYIKFLEIQTSL